MSNAIIDGTNIDTSVFSYSAPKPHASGGKVVNLYNKNVRESLTIATPLILTWGAQEGQEQGTKKPTGKWTMALQFPSADYSTPDLEAFLKSMRALEAKVKADAMTYSKEWFGKTITSTDVIEEKFNVMLRHPKKEKGSVEVDETKPPTLTVKIPQWSGVWKPEIYDEDGEPLFVSGKVNSHLSPLEFLKPKTHVICLIQCGGLWFVNGKISITWNLKQAVVQKPKPTLEGTCFLKPKQADKERLKSLPPPEDDVDPDGPVSTTISALVEDDDLVDNVYSHETREVAPVQEEPVVQAPTPAPVQAPATATVEEPKKKRIVSKKKPDA
jgi:hypothetical protein